jgi:hypothetical protein
VFRELDAAYAEPSRRVLCAVLDTVPAVRRPERDGGGD